MPGLKEVELQDNEFVGPIPEAFGKLVGLEVLNLSSNKLRGDVPECLNLCTKLRELVS